MVRILLPFLAFSSLAASAATVYSFDSGDWHLRGYRDTVNVGDNACVLSTAWPDGKKIQVNVFPQYDGTTNVTMTVLNPRWNAKWRVGERFSVRFDFASGTYGRTNSASSAEVYTHNKVIFRDLSPSFLDNFMRYDLMAVFANSNQVLEVSLAGTAALMTDLEACLATVGYGTPLSPGNR